MVSHAPTVTILMAMRNAAPTLPLALQSLIDQAFEDWHLVLLDDGSTDDSVSLARCRKDPRIEVVTDGLHRGLAVRMNQAIALATGRYLARMDSDDIAYPDRLSRQVAFLEAHPDVDLLGTGAMVFGVGGEPLGKMPIRLEHQKICARPWSNFYLPHPTWMGRREWFRRYGYDTSALKAQDYDLLLRSHADSRFACLPEVLLGYRLENLSLVKIVLSRWHTMKSHYRYFTSRRRYVRLTQALVEQALKMLADGIAMGSGLSGAIWRRRALPVSEPEKSAWLCLWGTLNAKVNDQCAA